MRTHLLKKSTALIAIAALLAPTLTGCKSKARRCNTCGTGDVVAPIGPSEPMYTPPPAPGVADGTGEWIPPAPEGEWSVGDVVSSNDIEGGEGYIEPMAAPDGDPIMDDEFAPAPAPSDLGAPLTELEPMPAQPSAEMTNRLSDLEARRRALLDRANSLENPAPPQPIEVAEDGLPRGDMFAGGASAGLADLAEDLRGVGGLEVIEEGRSVIVRLTNSFNSGSDRLKSAGSMGRNIEGAGSVIARYPDLKVNVVGHSDSQPIRVSGWASNQALSLARAKTVAGLLERGGVDRRAVNVDGRGEFEPLVAPERTASDRARNRRVEIVVSQ